MGLIDGQGRYSVINSTQALTIFGIGGLGGDRHLQIKGRSLHLHLGQGRSLYHLWSGDRYSIFRERGDRHTTFGAGGDRYSIFRAN
ncbi:MAG: hypothetical protein F6K19_38105 [Cyanothece sp. SIO1E1]|nr:hypothetical protein [Cyanothece sp. SIO1E1]